ncbi:DUF6266 family protein [Parapedobacter deserti]|uniref:DUF6266 family protein n=1 Tax=Parapedobacter deserti TaxID=1912957 RepID=A0ABV7JS91_9SPHI
MINHNGYTHTRSNKKVTENAFVQQRMRLGMAFLNPLRAIVAESWLGHGAGNKSKAFGQALKKLMQDAIEGHYPEQHIVPGRVMISAGMLPSLQIGDVVLSPEVLEIYFSSEENPMAKPADQVVLVVYSPEKGIAGRNTDGCIRSSGYLSVPLPPQLRDAPFHVYLFVHSANKKQYSRSMYVGSWEGRSQTVLTTACLQKKL